MQYLLGEFPLGPKIELFPKKKVGKSSFGPHFSVA